jgi:hypothetical protein
MNDIQCILLNLSIRKIEMCNRILVPLMTAAFAAVSVPAMAQTVQHTTETVDPAFRVRANGFNWDRCYTFMTTAPSPSGPQGTGMFYVFSVNSPGHDLAIINVKQSELNQTPLMFATGLPAGATGWPPEMGRGDCPPDDVSHLFVYSIQ